MYKIISNVKSNTITQKRGLNSKLLLTKEKHINTMKKALLISAFLILGIFNVSAQVDTVCAGATDVPYWVNGTAGSTFAWSVNGGTQSFGGTSDSITIDFSNTTGTDTLSVIETDSNGCPGDPVLIFITRMPLPDATIAAVAPLCFDDSTTLTITLTGTLPWDLTYNDGSGDQTVSVTSSPYTINTSGLTTSTTYTLKEVEDRLGCKSTLSGSSATSTVTVFPKIVTPAIQHN